jgi:hypothetical protein
VKRSVMTEAAGIPVAVVVAGANRNDPLLLADTLDQTALARPEPPPEQPQGLCLDVGYDYASTRGIAKGRKLTIHPRTRREEARAKQTAGSLLDRFTIDRSGDCRAAPISQNRIRSKTAWIGLTLPLSLRRRTAQVPSPSQPTFVNYPNLCPNDPQSWSNR